MNKIRSGFYTIPQVNSPRESKTTKYCENVMRI
jgi:hypothetical protein